MREYPPQNDALVWRLVLYTEAGENVRAKALAREMLTREPTFGPPRWVLGDILRTEGDIAGAIREQRAVLELAPANFLAIRLLALAYMDNGDVDKARALLEEKRPMFQTNYVWRHTWALLLAVEGKRAEARRVSPAFRKTSASCALSNPSKRGASVRINPVCPVRPGRSSAPAEIPRGHWRGRHGHNLSMV